MKKLLNVDDANKGDKIFVKETTPMWDSNTSEMHDHCFEYAFEVIRNNPKTLGCKYINGPYFGGGFNWVKGYALGSGKKEYFLIENDNEIVDRNYKA